MKLLSETKHTNFGKNNLAKNNLQNKICKTEFAEQNLQNFIENLDVGFRKTLRTWLEWLKLSH